jgi:arylformamidase
MDQMVADTRDAIRCVYENLAEFGFARRPLVTIGWSSGAHLIATQMSLPFLSGGLAISGVYDLEAMRLSTTNDLLKLDEAESRRHSPLLQLPESSAPLLVSFGNDELPEFRRQSMDFHAAWSARGLPGKLLPMRGRHHHSVVDELAEAGGLLIPELSRLAAT